jgi:hypothetical protein
MQSISGFDTNVYTLLFQSYWATYPWIFPVLFCIGLWPCCVCICVMQTIAVQLSNECSSSKRGKTINGIINRIGIMFSQRLFCPLVRCSHSWNGNNASDFHELCIYKVNEHEKFIFYSIYVQFFLPLCEMNVESEIWNSGIRCAQLRKFLFVRHSIKCDLCKDKE